MNWRGFWMICVSIGEGSVEACIRALGELDFAEVRLDRIGGIGAGGVRGIFSQASMGKKLIATCRKAGGNGEGAISEGNRERLLVAAIEAGAAYVDLELEMGEGMRGRIMDAARKAGCEVIVSFHDFGGTPSAEELERIVDDCFAKGADIAKVACMVESDKDIARLLGLLGSGKRLVVIGMGEKGEKTRVLAPLLGAEFTFASLGEGKETAPGQIGKGELEGIIRLMEERMEKD
jgi:3-dehydroquinate dehydratase-1